MFKVNTRDGRTSSFAHGSEQDLIGLSECIRHKGEVTGLSIHLHGTSFVFPSKVISESDMIGFDVIRKSCDDEIAALMIWVHARDTQTKMTVFCGGKSRMCRVDVARIGFKAGR